jgi:hypothetical protein
VIAGYFLRAFDQLRDYDLDGCSIALDLDIAELVAGDWDDHTVWLPAEAAPVTGVGLPVRTPATGVR